MTVYTRYTDLGNFRVETLAPGENISDTKSKRNFAIEIDSRRYFHAIAEREDCIFFIFESTNLDDMEEFMEDSENNNFTELIKAIQDYELDSLEL